MRIATWNVNSIRTRVDRVVDYLKRADIDVLAMQEIKCKPEQFPMQAFIDAGYHVELHGLNQWNGVAFASKMPAEDVEIGFPEMPSFKDVHEARALGATFDGVRTAARSTTHTTHTSSSGSTGWPRRHRSGLKVANRLR